ncbi:MAG: glycosyltransferase family 4 protein [Aquabacterium sp.]
MRILIIHQNFPGQFKHLAKAWSKQPGLKVLGMGRESAPGLPDVPWIRYKLHRQVAKGQHHYLRQMEHAVLHGQAVARALLTLKKKGFTPDVILAHPGWGETLFVKDVFPDVRLIHFCEWFYGQPGSDVDFDPEFPTSFDTKAKLRSWNALHLQNLENCDAAVTPTRWQWQQHPVAYRDKITIAHEGIDTANLGPNPSAAIQTPNGQVLKAGDPVITYVARNLEPYRGFHVFMRALEKIQQEHKQCHAVIVGGDDVSYGSRPSDAPNWREKMLREVKLDPTRTHFLGKVPYDTYKSVLQVSATHMYLSYPFVLSWSMLEAMASGCLIVGSNTEPVREVLAPHELGLIADFFDQPSLVQQALRALDKNNHLDSLRVDAMNSINQSYNLNRGKEKYNALLTKR